MLRCCWLSAAVCGFCVSYQERTLLFPYPMPIRYVRYGPPVTVCPNPFLVSILQPPSSRNRTSHGSSSLLASSLLTVPRVPLTHSGFSRDDEWGFRAPEPSRNIISSMALVLLKTGIIHPGQPGSTKGQQTPTIDAQQMATAQKLLLFWRKPAVSESQNVHVCESSLLLCVMVAVHSYFTKAFPGLAPDPADYQAKTRSLSFHASRSCSAEPPEATYHPLSEGHTSKQADR
jgi:hypothetical protein